MIQSRPAPICLVAISVLIMTDLLFIFLRIVDIWVRKRLDHQVNILVLRWCSNHRNLHKVQALTKLGTEPGSFWLLAARDNLSWPAALTSHMLDLVMCSHTSNQQSNQLADGCAHCQNRCHFIHICFEYRG